MKQKDRWRIGEKKNIKVRGPDQNISGIQHLKNRRARKRHREVGSIKGVIQEKRLEVKTKRVTGCA